MSGAGKRPGAAGELLAGKDAGASAVRFPKAPNALEQLRFSSNRRTAPAYRCRIDPVERFVVLLEMLKWTPMLAAVLHLCQSGREAQEREGIARLVTTAGGCRNLHIGSSAHCSQHLSFICRVLQPGRAALREHGE